MGNDIRNGHAMSIVLHKWSIHFEPVDEIALKSVLLIITINEK